MKQPRRRPLLLNQLGTWDLENIVRVLNGPTSPLRDELRALFARYQKSGPNLSRMLSGDKVLARKLERLWTVRYRPTSSGRADLELFPSPIRYPEEYEPALQIFSRLTFNPSWEKIGGPCDRCKKYFVRARASKNQFYCSRRCANIDSVTAFVERNAAKKLEKAQEAASRCPKNTPVEDWVQQETRFTKWWITRHKEELRPPSRRAHSKTSARNKGGKR